MEHEFFNLSKYQLPINIGRNIIDFTNANDLIQNCILTLSTEIENKKLEIISKRIKEIIGIELNIEEKKNRRFKRFCIENKDNEQSIYYNDGSIDGIRVITFVENNTPITYEKDKYEIVVSYSYY